MAILKTVTIAAALIAGATSLAIAQNGPATGGEPPVAGGAAASSPSSGGAMSKNMGMSKTHKTMKKKSMSKSKPQ